MTRFDPIPNKVSIAPDDPTPHPWPDFAPEADITRFYHLFDRAEGWLGESWFMIWNRALTRDLALVHMSDWPADIRFFGSDGGGTLGLRRARGGAIYLSAPDIGGLEDLRVLGDWPAFLDAVGRRDVI